MRKPTQQTVDRETQQEIVNEQGRSTKWGKNNMETQPGNGGVPKRGKGKPTQQTYETNIKQEWEKRTIL